MTEYFQNNLIVSFLTLIALLIIAGLYVVYQKISYKRFMKELLEEHENYKLNTETAVNVAHGFDKPKEQFLSATYESYETLSNLPKVGEINTLYFVRDTGIHYLWSEKNYDYRSLWFRVKDETDEFQELIIHYTDGTHVSHQTRGLEPNKFAYSEFMKWYLCKDTEYYNFRNKSGFTVIVRSLIKQVSYRNK